jgi:hypothetical protein
MTNTERLRIAHLDLAGAAAILADSWASEDVREIARRRATEARAEIRALTA